MKKNFFRTNLNSMLTNCVLKMAAIVFIFSGFLMSCQKGLLGAPEDSLLAQSSQEACGYVQNSAGARVSWKSFVPVVIYLDPQIPSEFVTPIQNAAEKWNSSSGKKLIDVRSTTSEAFRPAASDGWNGIYWVNEWDPSQALQQAITTIRYRGNSIYETDMKINAKNFSYYVSEPNSNQQVHMESLMIHEFGHLLGLKHLTTAPTVMWSTLAGATKRDVLSDQDLGDLKCEY